MNSTWALAGLASGLAVAALGWQRLRERRTILKRLQLPIALPAQEAEDGSTSDARPFVRRRRWVALLAGIVTAVLIIVFLPWHPIFGVLFGCIAGLLCKLLDQQRVARKRARIEWQLANAIDVMIGSLRAGTSLPAAIENALVESRAPLRNELEEVLGRLRLGDSPRHVFDGMMRRVPLESFRLLAVTMATHWDAGGNLTPTLATVGRSIRDRIEVSRRIRSMTMQSRASIISMLGATYFIALVIWRNDPERMAAFLDTAVGRYLVVTAIVLQVVGIIWSAAIGKVKY